MRTTLVAALCLTLFAGASAFANEPSADAKKQEMMKKWMEYSTPGEAHKVLAPMAGKWKYSSKWWETADGKAQESSGTSTMKLILGGRFLEHHTKGKAMGMPFEGLGITGYDNIKGKYDTIWLDSMGTGMMRGSGSFDSASQTLKDSGEFTCPMSDDKTRNYRGEWKIVDKNNMVYMMFAPGMSDDKEFKQMEMTFTRAGK